MLLFALIGILLIASALGVVAARNPIHSALCLILHLLTVSGVFAALNAHFLAAVQIIVYAGAIMVLVVFVIMLLNLKVEPLARIPYLQIVGASVLGACFVALLTRVFLVSFPGPADLGAQGTAGTVHSIGQLVFTKYVFPFEAASILIMAAVVGAAMLARRIRREGQA